MTLWAPGLCFAGVLVAIAVYMLGWRAGHLAAVRYDWQIFMAYLDGKPLPDDIVAQYTQEKIEKTSKGAWGELLADEEYQRQLRGQDE